MKKGTKAMTRRTFGKKAPDTHTQLRWWIILLDGKSNSSFEVPPEPHIAQ